jgi:outer membrane protein assembly factor BamB
VVLVALAALAAACSAKHEQRSDAPRGGRSLAMHESPPVPARQPSTRALLVVTVVNGDTNRRVRNAVVRIGRHVDRTNRHGAAGIRVPLRRPLNVTVKARGYSSRKIREPFQRRRKVTIRIYRPALQWPLYGASALRSQAQTEIALRPPFRVVWSRGMGSLIEFPAVVSDGVAYIGNAHGTIRALSMRFGSLVWRHDIPHGKLAASPAVAGPQVLVHDMDGHVWALDRRNGRLRWYRTIGSPIESSPVVWHGTDYFGTWSGRLYALNVRTHRIRWTRSLGAKITSSVAVAGGTVYVGDYAGRIWALAARTGRTRWVRHVNGRVYGTPAVAHRRVFVPSSTGGSLTAFTTGGRYLWSVHTGSYVYSSPAASGGRVFFGSYNGVFYCVSARTGRVHWRVGAGGAISGAAVVVAGVAYAGSFGHRITGVDARTGRVLLRFPHGEYVPVSGNGGRLLLHGFSRLYAVEPRHRRHRR